VDYINQDVQKECKSLILRFRRRQRFFFNVFLNRLLSTIFRIQGRVAPGFVPPTELNPFGEISSLCFE
jgi:hypothetical protein